MLTILWPLGICFQFLIHALNLLLRQGEWELTKIIKSCFNYSTKRNRSHLQDLSLPHTLAFPSLFLSQPLMNDGVRMKVKAISWLENEKHSKIKSLSKFYGISPIQN